MDSAETEKAALVALLQQSGVRWSDVTAAILECGSATEVMQEQLGDEGALFARADIDQLIADARTTITAWETQGIGVHAFFQASYPTQLRDIHEMPPILFTRGRLVDDRRSIAVVGTRQASDDGLRMARLVAKELAEHRIAVVSGLASGIDTAAHTAALQGGGRTIGVLGTGVRRHYPPSNRELQEHIAREGLIISQFWPEAPPTKQSFPMRNAVMSGYAAATVLIEAPQRSGARIQARLALEHGRPIVMPRRLLETEWARDYADRPGVFVADSLDDLLRITEGLVTQATSGLDLRGGGSVVAP